MCVCVTQADNERARKDVDKMSNEKRTDIATFSMRDRKMSIDRNFKSVHLQTYMRNGNSISLIKTLQMCNC